MDTLKLSRSICVLSSAFLFVSGMPTSSSAETKNMISTEKYGKDGRSLEFLSGELTAPSSKKDEDILYQYIDSQKHMFPLGDTPAKDSFQIKKKERKRPPWNDRYSFTTNVSRYPCLGIYASGTYYG